MLPVIEMNRNTKLWSLLLCLPVIHSAHLEARPQGVGALDNEGREFLCAFMPNARGVSNVGTPVQELHLTSQVLSQATIEYPAGAAAPIFSTTVTVTPGTIEIVQLPSAVADAWVDDSTAQNLVKVSGTEEFTCYLVNRAGFSSDAALALPEDTFNTSFILADYATSFVAGQGVFVVFAKFDDTTVTVTPSTDLVGGHTANVPFTISLDAGEGYYGRVANGGTDQNLTGTTVESDRVIGVSSGNNCTNIPSTFGFCDHMFEVLQPVQTWGSRYLVANLPNRPGGSIYRMIGSEDGTEILFNGVSQGTVNRGEFLEVGPVADDGEVVSVGGEPFFTVQYMTSRTFSSIPTGDPAMGNMIPPAQYKNSYTFSTVGGSQFAEHWITIIAATADVGTITLNGTAVAASEFSAIGTTAFSAARIQVAEGTYSTDSQAPHGVTVEGFNQDDSYLYPAGARFNFINPAGDGNAPLCDLDPLTGFGQLALTVRDDRSTEDTNGNGVLDAGEDLNSNGQIDEDSGIFFVELSAATANVQLTVTPFQAGDGVVSLQLDLVDPEVDGLGELLVTDGAGNLTVCPITLRGDLGSSICPGVPNSTGQASRTRVTGSVDVASNSLVLETYQLPPNVMSFYVNSRQAMTVLNPGGSQGNLCIASPAMGRHDASAAMTSAAGSTSLSVDLDSLPFEPGGVTAAFAGETWYWQLWHRDFVGGLSTSNFSNAVRVDLR